LGLISPGGGEFSGKAGRVYPKIHRGMAKYLNSPGVKPLAPGKPGAKSFLGVLPKKKGGAFSKQQRES